MDKLEKALGYEFKDKNNLVNAITHSSFSKEEGLPRWKCNERLEFLGDSVLGLIISQELFEKMEKEREGKMAKLKSEIVKAETLEKVARKLEIGRYLILGKGEEICGGRNKRNILADSVEAVIGAIFQEAGYKTARKIVLNLIMPYIDDAFKGKLDNNYKSALQEALHKKNIKDIKYEIIKEEGLSHDKVFYAIVSSNNRVLGKGKGKSKKEAENNAAKVAMENKVNN